MRSGSAMAHSFSVPAGSALSSSALRFLSPARLIANPSKEVHDDVRAQVRGHAARYVELWIHLNQVETRHVGALGDGGKQIAKLPIRHAVGLRRHTTRDEREIEDVDVDAHVAGRVRWNRVQDERRTMQAELIHGHHL